MDFDKLAKDVAKLEQAKLDTPDGMKAFVTTARDILTAFLKDRKEQIRPGKIFTNAAEKQIIPTDIAARADALLVRWGGSVTPTDPKAVADDAAKLMDVAAKLIPVLKAYKKEESP